MDWPFSPPGPRAGAAAARGRVDGHPHAPPPQDVWDVLWADDNPDLVALMEKGRMYVLRGGEPEEPVACGGYLAAFGDLEARLNAARRAVPQLCAACVHSLRCACRGAPRRHRPGHALCKALPSNRRWHTPPTLQVRAVLLDDVMARPESPELACLVDYETRSLRCVRAAG